MSMHWDAASQDAPGRRCGSGRRCGWRLTEIAAMVLGFIVFWPIGAAILAFKIWQQRTRYEGDLFSFCGESWDAVRTADWSAAPLARTASAWRSWGAAGRRWRGAHTGNRAFDDWRDAELARLEEERRKLEAAEREFADFMENLRRARDREEFDRFMRERSAGAGSGPATP